MVRLRRILCSRAPPYSTRPDGRGRYRRGCRGTIFIPHIHPVRFGQLLKVAAKSNVGSGIAPDAQCPSEFCCDWSSVRGHPGHGRLHQLAHNHGQLACDFVPELRIAFRGDLLREVGLSPGDGYAPLRLVKRIGLLFTANYRRDIGRIGVAVFRVNRHSITAGDGFDLRVVPAPFIPVRQAYQGSQSSAAFAW